MFFFTQGRLPSYLQHNEHHLLADVSRHFMSSLETNNLKKYSLLTVETMLKQFIDNTSSMTS